MKHRNYFRQKHISVEILPQSRVLSILFCLMAARHLAKALQIAPKRQQ